MSNVNNGYGYQSQLVWNHERLIDFGTSTTLLAGADLLKAVANAINNGSGAKAIPNFHLQPNSTGYGRRANAVWNSSSGNGAMVCTINGVDITVTYATSDINTAGLMAAAINASSNALVQYMVQATHYRGTLALSSVAAGAQVNVCGYTFTAVSGTPTQLGQFDISGSNTADATSLALAINKMPGLNDLVVATSSAANVFVYLLGDAAVTSQRKLRKIDAGFTVTQIAAVADCAVVAYQPGTMANCITIAASGTGASINGSAARLSGGIGTSVADIGTTL